MKHKIIDNWIGTDSLFYIVGSTLLEYKDLGQLPLKTMSWEAVFNEDIPAVAIHLLGEDESELDVLPPDFMREILRFLFDQYFCGLTTSGTFEEFEKAIIEIKGEEDEHSEVSD